MSLIRVFICFIFLALPLIGQSQVINTTDDSFQKDVVQSKVPVLVDFWATWCGPCRMYSPIVDEIAKEYGSKLKVCRINVDENPNISRQFRISAIPASFILKKGKIVKYWFGMEPLQAVKDQLKEILRVARKVKADSSKP